MELDKKIFGNQVILSKIFSHLDYSHFKTARFVANFWNEIAKQQIKSFNLQLNLLLSDLEEVFFEKSQLLQNYGIQNIFISNDGLHLSPQKPWESFENILTEFGPQILRIELKFLLLCEEDKIISLFKNILKSCTSALELRMNFDSWNSIEKIEQSYQNSSIRKLVISSHHIPQRRFRNLFKLFPNLEEVECDGGDTVAEFFGEVYSSQELEKLKVLKLTDLKWRSSYSSIWAKDVKIFPQLPNLVKLEISDFHINNYDSFYPHELCYRFKANLEDFTVGLVLDRDFEITFTKMEKLQSLKLKFENEAEEKVKIVFKSGHGLATKNFPKLKKLRMELGFNSKSEQFIVDNFGSLINAIVEELVFIFPSEEEMKKFIGLATTKFSQSFPNAQLKFDHCLP